MQFIEHCKYTKKLRPATIRGYEASFAIFVKLMPEIKYPNDLEIHIIDKFFSRLSTRTRIVGKRDKRTGVKVSTTRTYWNKLNVFFTWLVDYGYIQKTPLNKNNKPAHPEYNDKKELSIEDIEKLICAIDRGAKNTLALKRDKALFYLLLYTGMRKGEIIGLRMMDVDLDNGVLRINGNTSKSKRNRILPINKVLEMHLREYIIERNKKKYKTEKFIVSLNKDCGLTEHGYKHWVNKLKLSSGVHFHLHQFRHTFASTLGRKNIGAYKLQKLLGHSDMRMTERYLRSIDVEDLRGEVDKMFVENNL